MSQISESDKTSSEVFSKAKMFFGAWLIVGNGILTAIMIVVTSIGSDLNFSYHVIFTAAIAVVGLALTSLLVSKVHFSFEIFEYRIKALFWLISWT